MRIFFSFFVALAAFFTSASVAKAALILRTINFTTGQFVNFDRGFPLIIAPPVTGSISTIFDNSNTDITFNRNPAIINSFSLPFSGEATFEITFNGFNQVFGNVRSSDLSNQDFDFQLLLFPSNTNTIVASFRYFDPVRNLIFNSFNFNATRIDVSLVPEPDVWLLFFIGFGFIGYSVRVKRLQILAA